MPESLSKPDVVFLMAEVVSAYVAHNSLPSDALGGLIQSVHDRLTAIARGPAETPVALIRESIQPDYLICFDDGKRFKSLKRHLRALGMTPEQYRAKWRLPPDYPMIAANYAVARSELAKKIGLGIRERKNRFGRKPPDGAD